MIRRILDAIRRWWYGDNHGVHARPRRGVDFIDVTQATITRARVTGRPPWETAPMPAICLFPSNIPGPAGFVEPRQDRTGELSAAPAPLTSVPGPELPPPAPVADPRPLHPIVQAELGAVTVAEYIERLFPYVPLPAAA